MKPHSAAVLADWCGGRILRGAADREISSVSTDTRTLQPGALFVALTGENFNGHLFIPAAAEKRAAACLVSQPMPEWPEGMVVIEVPDTLLALQAMARAWRIEWGGKVLAITGSNGKTSTKDLAHSVLSRKFSACATTGNLNNHIGVPLSILSANPAHEIGVFEMGMNHPGELVPLVGICAPNAAIITNIGTAHLEFMGTREAIAQEKGSLAEGVPAGGVVILNADDAFTDVLASRCHASVLRAGFAEGADVRVTEAVSNESGSTFVLRLPDGQTSAVQLPVPGRHMVGNAALAAAAGWHFGLTLPEIVAGIEAVALNRGRLQLKSIGGVTFLDDSYNANPDSMRAALETLKSFSCQGRRFAVLGRMAELGGGAREEHLLLGKAAVDAGIDALCAVGSMDAALIAEGTEHLLPVCEIFESHADCAAYLAATLKPEDIVLVKGSRSAAMEKVIEAYQTLQCSTGSTNC
jgi:UDP-N-acetylmuramoyl-tripeptide--D-alanyl-D-alanine ligase